MKKKIVLSTSNHKIDWLIFKLITVYTNIKPIFKMTRRNSRYKFHHLEKRRRKKNKKKIRETCRVEITS